MKGNKKVIDVLNDLLSDELTAISQYMVHSEMCKNWQYDKLHEKIEKRAVSEMKHAEQLIGRILFLEGRPTVSALKKMHIGEDIQKQFASDLNAEEGAVKAYNAAIKLCFDEGDNGSRELLDSILKDEEEHLDWIEAQLDHITKMTMENYLTIQV